jgi:hypothetical protein
MYQNHHGSQQVVCQEHSQSQNPLDIKLKVQFSLLYPLQRKQFLNLISEAAPISQLSLTMFHARLSNGPRSVFLRSSLVQERCNKTHSMHHKIATCMQMLPL